MEVSGLERASKRYKAVTSSHGRQSPAESSLCHRSLRFFPAGCCSRIQEEPQWRTSDRDFSGRPRRNGKDRHRQRCQDGKASRLLPGSKMGGALLCSIMGSPPARTCAWSDLTGDVIIFPSSGQPLTADALPPPSSSRVSGSFDLPLSGKAGFALVSDARPRPLIDFIGAHPNIKWDLSPQARLVSPLFSDRLASRAGLHAKCQVQNPKFEIRSRSGHGWNTEETPKKVFKVSFSVFHPPWLRARNCSITPPPLDSGTVGQWIHGIVASAYSIGV